MLLPPRKIGMIVDLFFGIVGDKHMGEKDQEADKASEQHPAQGVEERALFLLHEHPVCPVPEVEPDWDGLGASASMILQSAIVPWLH